VSDSNEDSGVGFYGWKNVALLFSIYAITMGFVFYGFAVIFPTMIQTQGWGRGEASLAHSIRGLVMGLMAPVAAFCIGKIGAGKTLRIGVAVAFVALVLLGTVTTEIWQWTLLWGVVMPVAFAMGGVVPAQTVVSFWFDRRRATAMGIVMSASALAGFVAAPLYTYLMEASGSWQSGWLAGAGFCVAAFAATFFVANKPADLGQHPDGITPGHYPWEENAAAADSIHLSTGGPERTTESWTLREAVRTRVLWLLLVCMIGEVWVLYLATVHGVLHLIDKGFSSMQAASVIANLILFNGIARFPTGVLADRIEPRILKVIAHVGMSIAVLGLWQAPASISLVLVISGALGFFFGVTTVTFPMILANCFGPNAFASISGFVLPITIVFGAPIPFLAGLIFDRYGSYDLAFMPVAALALVGAFCAWFMYLPQKEEARNADATLVS